MEELIFKLISYLFGGVIFLLLLCMLLMFLREIWEICIYIIDGINWEIPTFKKKIKTRTISEAEHLEYERLKKEHKAAQEELEQVINS